MYLTIPDPASFNFNVVVFRLNFGIFIGVILFDRNKDSGKAKREKEIFRFHINGLSYHMFRGFLVTHLCHSGLSL